MWAIMLFFALYEESASSLSASGSRANGYGTFFRLNFLWAWSSHVVYTKVSFGFGLGPHARKGWESYQ
jgi:hypothetical protein